MILIIIIIILRNELGLHRPVLASSNWLVKSLPSRLCPFGPQFSIIFASCCSFLLYVIVNMICIFLVSRQLVLLSALPKFRHSLCGQKSVYPAVPLKNFISIDINCSFLRAQI